MSRRLRFQVKPNINAGNVAADEGKLEKKLGTLLPTPAATPISEPKGSSEIIFDESTVGGRSPSPSRQTTTVLSNVEDDRADVPVVLVSSEAAPRDKDVGHDENAPNDQATASTALTEESIHLEKEFVASGENQIPSTSLPPPMHLPRLRPDSRAMRAYLKGKSLDKSTFLMRDLIYWTPPEEEEKGGDENSGDDETASIKTATSESDQRSKSKKKKYVPRFDASVLSRDEKHEQQDGAKPSAPQVKVNADGTITIDESSLVVDRRDQGTEIDFETVDETWGYGVGPPRRGPRLTSMSFRRNRKPPRGKIWSKLETDKFYRILSFVGLDFTLMHELFSSRNRTELKRKYKRECIGDPGRLDAALLSKSDRYGPWKELKSIIATRGLSARDKEIRELLESAKEMIDAEDDRIELELRKRNPTVQEACRLADRISKGGFGSKKFKEDDVSPERLQAMAEKIVKKEETERRKQERKTKKQSNRKRKGVTKKESDLAEPSDGTVPSTLAALSDTIDYVIASGLS